MSFLLTDLLFTKGGRMLCIGSDHVSGHVRVDRMWSPVAFVESS